ncbi:hypothetical protein [Candidatus Korobacter versatilis]|nr:hypothetical protein [Candidatus Koribacter versatilis]
MSTIKSNPRKGKPLMALHRLFSKYAAFSVQQGRQQRARELVQVLPPERLAEDEATLASEIVNSLAIAMPKLEEGEMFQTDRLIKVDARTLPNRLVFDDSRPTWVEATEITVHIPFTGDPAMLDVQPSTHQGGVLAEIDSGRSEILLIYQLTDADPNISSQIERAVREIKMHLGWLQTDFSNSDGLVQSARSEISRRKSTIEQHAKIINATGLPRKQ